MEKVTQQNNQTMLSTFFFRDNKVKVKESEWTLLLLVESVVFLDFYPCCVCF